MDKVLTVEFVPEETSTFRLTEVQAMRLFHKMQATFGWAGTLFTREDVENRARSLTDDEWSRVRTSWQWRRGMSDGLTERGWYIVDAALVEAGITEDDEG